MRLRNKSLVEVCLSFVEGPCVVDLEYLPGPPARSVCSVKAFAATYTCPACSVQTDKGASLAVAAPSVLYLPAWCCAVVTKCPEAHPRPVLQGLVSSKAAPASLLLVSKQRALVQVLLASSHSHSLGQLQPSPLARRQLVAVSLAQQLSRQLSSLPPPSIALFRLGVQMGSRRLVGSRHLVHSLLMVSNQRRNACSFSCFEVFISSRMHVQGDEALIHPRHAAKCCWTAWNSTMLCGPLCDCSLQTVVFS